MLVRNGVVSSKMDAAGMKDRMMLNQLPNWIDSIWKTSPTSTSSLKQVFSSTLSRSALLTVLHSSMTRRS